MDTEKEITHLSAETMALQALLVGLFQGLNKSDTGKRLVREAFDHADKVTEIGLFNSLGAAQPNYLPMLAKVLEDLRSASVE